MPYLLFTPNPLQKLPNLQILNFLYK
jgi:hypothetical protein